MSTANHLLLAGDVGGTKVLLGLFDTTAPRPRALETRSFPTLDYGDLCDMVDVFLGGCGVTGPIEAACIGVAGPVIDGTAEVTNVPWTVRASELARRFGIPRVVLLNDLEAMAYSVPVLADEELAVLQEGTARSDGNMALIAAGTGLGEALLCRVQGRLVPSASEAGHADFAARTEREIKLLRELTARYGRADVEHVISGRGLFNIFPITHEGRACTGRVDLSQADAPAAITGAALAKACSGCEQALELFIEAYGAEAGNLALRAVATSGVYIGGGIAAKILPALTDGRFLHAFRAKPPLEALVAAVPVKVILNPNAALVGAAAYLVQ